MDKREFLEGVREVLQGANDDNSELNVFIKEGRQIATELREHDAGVADKVTNIVVAMEDLISYVKERNDVNDVAR